MTYRCLPVLSTVVMACLAGLSAPAHAAPSENEKVGELIGKVKLGSLTERLSALDRLSQLRDVKLITDWKVVDLLQELAGDENPRISRKSVKAMGDLVMGADRAIKEQVRGPLTKVLENSALTPLVRAESASQLGRILVADEFSDAQAVGALIKVAKSSGTPEAAAAAILALGEIGDAKGKEAIRTGLSSTDAIVKEAALEALGKFLSGKNAKDMVDATLSGLLMKLLSDANLSSEAKERILESVGRAVSAGASKEQAESAILRVIETEERPSTVKAALKAIGFAGSAKAAGVLVSTYEKFSIKEGDKMSIGSDLRTQVCITAGELFDLWHKQRDLAATGHAAAVLSELLTKAMIDDTSDSVRKEAVVALGNLYDKRYDRRKPVAALIAMLGTLRADDMKGMVAESIEMLTGRSFGTDAERWERWFGANQSKLSPSSN